MKFAQEIIGLCHFRLTSPLLNSKLFDVFSIQNGAPYLSDAKKKLANVTDQKQPNHKGFSVLFKLAVYLFNHLRIHPFVH